MMADAIKGIADDYELANASVERRFYAKVIARAKQLLVTGVPECEGKIPLQMFDASRAPCRVSVQNQIAIRYVRAHVLPGELHLVDQFLAGIEPRIRDNPIALLHVCRLPLAF